MKSLAVLLVLLVLAGAAFAATPSAPPPGRTVPCKEIILGTKWPYIGSRQPEHRYRIVLGTVSVPPASMPEVEGPEPGTWPYWRKSGLVVKAGAGPVDDQRRPGYAWPGRDRLGKRRPRAVQLDPTRALCQRLGWLRVCRRLLTPLPGRVRAADLPRRLAQRDRSLRRRAPLLGSHGARLHELVDRGRSQAPPRAS